MNSATVPRRLGRPRQIDRQLIVGATLVPPTSGSDRWSCRELSAQLGVSEATVARIWREYGIAPRSHGEYAFTVQPELSATTVSVVGVCVTRRVRAIALVVDDGGAGPPAPRPIRPAGLDASDRGAAADGEAERSRPAEATTKVGVRDFLRRLTETYPDRSVHVVVDSANLQRLLLQSVPHLTTAGVSVHFALDTEKWLNLVDVWHGLMARDDEADANHPAARVRELLTHGRTIIWIDPAGSETDGTGFRSYSEAATWAAAGHEQARSSR